MSSGIWVELYCGNAIPEDQVIEITVILIAVNIDCVMLVGDDLLQSKMPGTKARVVVVPPPFMGQPMDSVEALRAWVERISPGVRPFREVEPEPADWGDDSPEDSPYLG